MVSVVSSVLSQTLWRVLGGGSHHPWFGERRSPLSVTHNGRQQQPQHHALACCGGEHVSEMGEPGAWVLLDPLTPAAAPSPTPSLVELCAPAYRAEGQQECGHPSPDMIQQGQPAPAPTPAKPRVSLPQSHEAASGDEEFCCVATHPCVISAGKEHPSGVTLHDQEAVVAGSAAAAGSSAGSGRARWWRRRRRQFVERRRLEHPSCAPSRHCPSRHAAHTMDCPSGTSAPLRAAPPPCCPSQRGPASPAAPYNEDIRDFDIYKIIRTGEEGQYPRLPALPTQSDSDTDDSIVGTHEALRRRKRRNPEPRMAGRKKLHREEEEITRVEADAATRLLAPPLHRGTTTTHPATPPRPAAPPPCSSPTTLGHCWAGGSWGEGVGDRSEEEDEDEDDDETSTVVPDDFANDTDSDIEVLIQSGKCETTANTRTIKL